MKDAADRETDDYKWPYCSARTPHTLTQLMLVSSTRVLEPFFAHKIFMDVKYFWNTQIFMANFIHSKYFIRQ